ncbi:MAG TPA: 2-amino-4-hydroxy-6-hydroxymethyldihydropteridine diphosphokinase [Acidiferrobacterales bacterium]
MTSGDGRARAYIALGSNLDDPIAQVRRGAALLAALPTTHWEAGSSLYRTAPVGRADQPDFINAVCRLSTALAPEALMRALLDIEAARGRRRGEPGGPRTLDLDLLLYFPANSTVSVTREAPGLTLPHPRLHERAFVLYPLAEIAPDAAIPGRGRVADLLAGCAGQRIERLASGLTSGEQD